MPFEQHKRRRRLLASGQLVGILLLLLPVGQAGATDWKWSVSPLLGVYSPRLGDLYSKEFQTPLPGTGGVVIDQGVSDDYDFTIRNPLPKIHFATEAGVELQLEFDEKNRLLLGFGSWEGVSTSVIQTEMPFQGELSQVIYERSGRISTTQYFIGLRHDLFNRDKRRLYLRTTINEIMDVDYKEDMTFAFISGPAEGFKRVVVMQSQATGILMLQLGLGGELFLRDWLSLGFDAGYMKGVAHSTLGNATSRDDFQSGDNVDLRLPANVGPDGRLRYLDSSGTTYKKMYIDFEGWRALLRINFYF
jgi:hypothetical protein